MSGRREVSARSGRKRGVVYVFADLERGLLKIGYTDGDVERRRRQIEAASGASLALLGLTTGTRDDEMSAHEMFAEHRTRGEWFRTSEAALSWATELPGIYA